MLCLYLKTLIGGHKPCMLSIVNKISLQQDWQYFMTLNVLHQNNEKATTTKAKMKINV